MQTVTPMLSYEDPAAALDWLTRAFGFKETVRMADDAGVIGHAEMDTGAGGMIMIACPTPDYRSPRHHRETCAVAARWLSAPWVINGVHVYVDNIDAHHARARAAGAVVLGDMEDGFPGRRYRVEDLEGQRWMFMQRP